MIFDAGFSTRFELFMANIDCKPLGFYAKHVKNLWILAADDPDAFERILTICSGVVTSLSGNRSANEFEYRPNTL
jgi:hypothetical protein